MGSLKNYVDHHSHKSYIYIYNYRNYIYILAIVRIIAILRKQRVRLSWVGQQERSTGSPASQSAVVSQDQSCQTAATKDDKGKADQGSGHVQHIDWMVVVVVVVVVIVVVVFLVLLALLALLVLLVLLVVVVVVVICGIILFWENILKT